MKNIFVLFCSLCMVFLLTGCDSLDYRKAIGEQEAGNYSSAIDIFQSWVNIRIARNEADNVIICLRSRK